MKPIINPLWFYLIELCARFGTGFIVGGLAIIIIGGIFTFFEYMTDTDEISFSERQLKRLKRILILGIITLTIGSIIPSRDTCYKMFIASYVTTSNIDSVEGEATKLVDYIVEKIDELNDTEESD